MLTAAVLTVTGYWPGSVLTASAEPYSGAAQLGRADIAYSDNTFGAMLSRQGIMNADVDHSGSPDPDDIVLILRLIAKLITSFP